MRLRLSRYSTATHSITQGRRTRNRIRARLSVTVLLDAAHRALTSFVHMSRGRLPRLN
jgi:hypothetical protein